MRQSLLLLGGVLLGLSAEAILCNGPALYGLQDAWFSLAFTRVVGLGLIAQGAVVAFGAALCLGRALAGTAEAPAGGGGPVLPIFGTLFLLAALGPFQQAQREAHRLEVMKSVPDGYSPDLLADFRRSERDGWTFALLWLVAGCAFLGTPLFLNPRVWRMTRGVSRAGCGIAIAGLLLSGFSVFVWFANGLTMEAASKEVSFLAHLGVLAGTLVAVTGSILAATCRARV
jgi:hypothetical protein